MSEPPAGRWFVRFAGRRSGPYDLERLRTLARRGALTSLHFLSADGASWEPATAVRSVFNADGSVASGQARPEGRPDDSPLGLVPLPGGAGPGASPESRPAAIESREDRESPSDGARRGDEVLVAARPVAIAAVALATAALLVSVLAEAPRLPSWCVAADGPQELRLVVRILQFAAVAGGAVALALRPDRARSAVTGAVAGVITAVSAWDARDLPWACAALLAAIPVAPMLALHGDRSGASRAIAAFVALAAPLAAAATLRCAFTPTSAPWPGLAAVAAGGCAAIAAGAASALGWFMPGAGRTFALAGGGTAAIALASMLPAALGAGDPVLREVAVDACAVLAFGGACWAAALGLRHDAPATGQASRPGPGRGVAA